MPMRLIRSSPKEPREYIIVQLKIGGRGPFDFVLDTGCSTTMVTPMLAYRRLGIPEDSGKMTRGLGGMGTAGGQGRQVSLPEIALGSYNLGPLEAVVLDLSYTGLDPTIFGIVGLNLLSKFDVDFNFATQLITFYKAGAAARGQLGMQGMARLLPANMSFGLPAIQVAINSGPTEVAILDMGSPLSLVNWAAAQRAGLTPDSPTISRGSLSVVAIGGGGGQMCSGVMDVSILVQSSGAPSEEQDRITFQKMRVAVGNLPALDMLQAGMIVGLQLFKGARLVACFSENAFFLRREVS